ncbi:hypothetical protein L1049_024944 [Liquidambar formosana]|uniref:MLO-like protein n=1 Tax=Liquidambar formosana TaxID=63359 RepID=A0AAP0WYU5_LIQFO
MNQGIGSLEETPTWAVSVLCFVLLLLSFIIDTALHYLTKFLRRRKRKSLNKALEKIKLEMMIMGFITLFLTVSEIPISKICVTEAVANSFLPCKDPLESTQPDDVSSATETEDGSYCEAKGMVSLVSREGIMQLRIFIFVLAVFHILYCVFTMFLGCAQMRKWKAWEEETQTFEYQIAHDPERFRLAHQTSFGRRHLKLWSDHPLLLWPVCFVRQFRRSISKTDYFTLRHGFIKANCAEGSNFNFQRFLARAFDNDFKQVVGISAHGFYNYYWLSFIPLVIVLIVGTKLQVIITKMCLESYNENSVTRGTFLVKPNDDFFWFGRPEWLLHLLQLVLIQNSFQLAFFTWTWYEYGLRSCFNRETENIALRTAMGAVVLFLCGYVTLPLYALVTQMGSGKKTAVFTERVARGLKHWHNVARHNLSKNRFTSRKHSSDSRTIDNNDTSNSDMQNSCLPKFGHLPPSAVMNPPSSPEIDEEAVQHGHTPSPAEASFATAEINEEETHPMIINRGTYDGEISFGSSWKELECRKGNGATTSIIEENTSDIITEFNQ